MLRLEFYETYLTPDNIASTDEVVRDWNCRKVNRVYDMRSLNDYINSLGCAGDYNLTKYRLVHCLKYLITNRITPVECRGLRSVSFLGLKMENRFDRKDYTHIVVGNRKVALENMQILDISRAVFLHDRFETLQTMQDLQNKSRNNALTLQHLMRLSFSKDYETVIGDYVRRMQAYLSSHLRLSMSKEVVDGETVTVLNVINELTGKTVDLDKDEFKATDLAVILLPYLFMYTGIEHRTIFIDTSELPEDLLNQLIRFVSAPEFKMQTIILY